MKVALYARVSTDDKQQNPETQTRILKMFAEARGYEIVREYIDFRSGKDANRPEFQNLMIDAKHHMFDIILVTKLDRIMRSTKNLLNVLDDLERWKVGFECVQQPIETTSAMGRLMITVIGAMAEFERELISERVKDGMARAKAEGKKCGHPMGVKNKNKRRPKGSTPLYLVPAEKAAYAEKQQPKEILYRPSHNGPENER